MKNFIFKSTAADLQKILQSFEIKLDTQGKNILYITYQVDKILKIVDQFKIETGLQKQVDEYFEEDDKTSPQTDSDEQ